MIILNDNRVQGVAADLVKIAQGLFSNPDKSRAGGYLTYGGLSFPEFALFSTEVGTFPRDKTKYYRENSIEKALRLSAEFVKNPGETFSSWQTRDEAAEKYGGAVLFRDSIYDIGATVFSFSGFPERVDEAICLALAHFMGIKDNAQTEKIIGFSDNNSYREMHKIYRMAFD